MLTILNVAYPLAPVGPDSVGGAEQVLTALDSALTRAGHHSIVIAAQGSQVCGTLLSTPRFEGVLDEGTRNSSWLNHRAVIANALNRWKIDLVHLHGVDVLHYLPEAGVPVLVTLHLPPDWYPPEIFRCTRPATFFNCVSLSQTKACPPCASLLPPVENGVDTDFAVAPHAKRQFVLCLGRICPEKGYHHALDAAHQAGIGILLAGKLFSYVAHREFFQREIQPRLSKTARFIGPVGLRRKRRLLTSARALLVPSLVPETSSLVAMEALACGTPVIAYPSGALPEIVEHGRTGFLVKDIPEMAEAISAARQLSPAVCRRAAGERFNFNRTMTKYFELYQELTDSGTDTGKAKGAVWLSCPS